jgi:hypothetical protein
MQTDAAAFGLLFFIRQTGAAAHVPIFETGPGAKVLGSRSQKGQGSK